ncbi:MAG: FlhC family transcriptional regulator [Gallionella sp.]
MSSKSYSDMQSQAAILIKGGMRIALAHSVTGLPMRMLRDLWSGVHGELKPPGRMPYDTIAYIKSGQSVASLATVVSVYLRAEKECKPTIESFLNAWEVAQLSADIESSLDINAAWYAVRDVKAGVITLCRCNHCEASYIFDSKATRKFDGCNYCGTKDKKIIGAGQ